ncbi:MAG: endonuclease MutS2 [bacterium]
MMRFDKYTLDSLEYHKIREAVAKRCLCEGGKRHVERLKPTIDSLIIDDALTETEEMKQIILFEAAFPLSEAEKIDLLIDKVKVEGSILEPEQLKKLSDFLGTILALNQYKREREERFPNIVNYLKQLNPLDDLVLRIDRAIDRGGEVKDSASDKLRRLRAEKINARARIMDRLNRILGKQTHKSDRVDDIITLREGRYVISVPDTDFDNKAGIVHDRSRSGATLYVEPFETVEFNNRLKGLELEEKQEIERILLELTDFARSKVDVIERDWALFAKLDFIHAKGQLAVDLDAVKPEIKNEPVVKLLKARHPLMLLAAEKRSEIVPIDVELGFKYNVLVITGPNTGGKTVAVKTVGLLALMLQSGLLIPVDDRSELGIFEKIFADIGDEQSIELSLSTFSSHISRITDAISECDRDSLLLFDEIGAGTDPKEGAALGEAIIEHVVRAGSRCVVTTHYSSLKTIAETDERIENASFEFDRQTLQPTFKLRRGVPGSSYAVEIAARLGMPKDVIKRAGELVGTQERSLADLIARLEEQLNAAEIERAQLKEQLDHAHELEAIWKEKSQKVQAREKELAQHGYAEADQLVEETRRRLEQVIRELREQQATKGAIKRGKQTIDELREELAGKRSPAKSVADSGDPPVAGDRVWVEKLQTDGELVELFGDGKRGKVRIGKVLYTMELADLTRLENEAEPHAIPAGVNYEPFREDLTNEVSLRGLTVEEAGEKLDQFFDQIALANFPSVRIVHGKGTGALRRFVREYLSKQAMVDSFELGQWNEGGDGVTVAKLKS